MVAVFLAFLLTPGTLNLIWLENFVRCTSTAVIKVFSYLEGTTILQRLPERRLILRQTDFDSDNATTVEPIGLYVLEEVRKFFNVVAMQFFGVFG
jgi:hypothetical protein